MSEAVEAQLLTANPCRDVRSKLLKREQRKLVPLISAEVDALANAIALKHPPYGTLTRSPHPPAYARASYTRCPSAT